MPIVERVYISPLLSGTDIPVIIVSQDMQPMPESLEDWRVDIGKSLANFVDDIPERTVVAISGDTSHMHLTDCTDTLYLPDPR